MIVSTFGLAVLGIATRQVVHPVVKRIVDKLVDREDNPDILSNLSSIEGIKAILLDDEKRAEITTIIGSSIITSVITTTIVGASVTNTQTQIEGVTNFVKLILKR